jgi:hypothetical protein
VPLKLVVSNLISPFRLQDFSNNHGAIIMLDYYDEENNDQELVVTFEKCRFHENRYFGYGSQTSLIVGNNEKNRIVIQSTVFNNNDMTWNNTSVESTTHLIESLGPTIIEQSCFMSNPVVGSSVVVYGNEFRSSRIYTSASSGRECDFASIYETYDQFKSRRPLCVAATLPTCDLEVEIGDQIDENATIVNQYVPFAIGAMDYDLATESDSVFQGGCTKELGIQEKGPDAQNNADGVCKEYGGCFISHTVAGEQVWYRFGHYQANEDANGSVYVDITVRMSSDRPKLVQLDLLYEEENDIAESWVFETEDAEFDRYQEYTWESVPLRGNEPIHTLVVTFIDGMVNFCMIKATYSAVPSDSGLESETSPTDDGFQIVPSQNSSPSINEETLSPSISEWPPPSSSPISASEHENDPPLHFSFTTPSSQTDAEYAITVPGLYSALYFTEESLSDDVNGLVGDCPSRSDSMVHAWLTSDLVCGEATNEYGSPCFLGVTTPGKWIDYDFSKDPSNEELSVSIRISSPKTEPLELFIYSKSSDVPLEAFWGLSPGLGDEAIRFSTYMVWNGIKLGSDSNYRLRVVFPNGGVKLCAVGFL